MSRSSRGLSAFARNSFSSGLRNISSHFRRIDERVRRAARASIEPLEPRQLFTADATNVYWMAYGAEAGRKQGSFLIDVACAGGTAPSSFAVNFTLSGTATETTDYDGPIVSHSATVTQVGSDHWQAVVLFTPVDDVLYKEDTETVVMTLTAGTNYTFLYSSATSATSNIANDPGGAQTCSCKRNKVDPAKNISNVTMSSSSGQSLMYSNAVLGGANVQGTGWSNPLTPQLASYDGGNLVGQLGDGSNVEWFDYNGSTYAPKYDGLSSLTHASSQFTKVDAAGVTTTFYDFDASLPDQKKGLFKKQVDSAGNVMEATSYTTAGNISRLEYRNAAGTVLQSYDYTYNTDDILTDVTYKVSGTTSRTEHYTYSGTGQSSLLTLAETKDASGNVLDTNYFRYYGSGDPNGLTGQLKMMFGPDSLERLKAAHPSDWNTAADSVVDDYADTVWTYQSNGRVATQAVQGEGCSTCSGGVGTYTFTQSYNPTADTDPAINYNTWRAKTINTLPDGNTYTDYSNEAGQVMLDVFTNTATGDKWGTFYKYDGSGHQIMVAQPSAVNLPSSLSTIEAYDDLMHSVSGNYAYLYDGRGEIENDVYPTTTTATGGGVGDVVGYLKSTSIQHGETGTAIPQTAQTYVDHHGVIVGTSTFVDVYPVASSTVYRNDNGTGGETTSSSYNWLSSCGFAGTCSSGTLNHATSMTMTLPTVTSAENGPNASTYVTAAYDAFDRPVWTKDEAGFITYTEYDAATGAVTKEINDVDTTVTSNSLIEATPTSITTSGTTATVTLANNTYQAGDWVRISGATPSAYNGLFQITGVTSTTFTYTTASAPGSSASGRITVKWGTPPGGGLQLTANYVVDKLGRTTKTTDPNGNVTYTVYNDTSHEVRVYPGWNATTGTTTGPIQVLREDRANQYTEMLTTTATPTTSGSAGSYVPTGAETIASSNIQSLVRSNVNIAGQVTSVDRYFDLTGVTYSTSAGIGTLNTNYYRTTYAYDDHGLQKEVIAPTGTITWTDYGVMGRPDSVWVGTDATGATNTDPTGGGAAGNNLVKVEDYQYDGGGVGDSDLTKTTDYPGGGADARVTENYYDWRGRAIASKGGVQTTEGTGVQRPIVYSNYDNLGEVTTSQQFDGDNVSMGRISEEGGSDTDGVPDAPSSSLLRAKSTASYDEQGEVYQSDVYGVDNTGCTFGGTIRTNTFYDVRGNPIKSVVTGGATTKMQYDGEDRPTKTFTTDGGGDAAWSDADDVTGDQVLEQSQTTYDANGNVIFTTTKARFHDETATGELGTNGTAPKARVSFTAAYYDAADRPTDIVDLGANGCGAYSRPGSVPTRSDTTLVTSYRYGNQTQVIDRHSATSYTLTFSGQTTSSLTNTSTAAQVQTALEALSNIDPGDIAVNGPVGGPYVVEFTAQKYAAQNAALMTASSTTLVTAANSAGTLRGATIDPRGIVGVTQNDLLGRTTKTIAGYGDGTPSAADDQTTLYGYDGDDHVVMLTADMPSGQNDQTTAYTYGVTTAGGSAVNSNDLLKEVAYRNASTGAAGTTNAEKNRYTYNALGENVTMIDQNGTTHTYSYDVLGRMLSDDVGNGTLPTGVDGSVRKVAWSFDTAGRLEKTTSTDSSNAVVNQAQDVYNGHGQLTTEYQEHSGSVNTGTSLKVQYAYDTSTDGSGILTKESRPTSMTYPNGRKLRYEYSSGLDDTISRLSFLADDNSGSVGTHLEEYSYLGLSTVVKRAHPESGVDLTYIASTGTGDAGDKYVGLDRFGRVVDQRWVNGSGTDKDRSQYAYDRDSNVLYKNNTVNSAFSELYSASDDVVSNSIYDALNRLQGYQQGTLSTAGTNNGTLLDTVATATRTQSFTLDALGNWGDTTGTATTGVTTNGTAQTRKQNSQNELTEVAGSTLTYDADGNMTTDETGKQFLYDAWNRLVTVKDSTGSHNVIETRAYDGAGRMTSTVASGTTTHFLYSNQGQVLEERVSGAATNQYVWSPVYVNAMVERDRNADSNTTTGSLGNNGSGTTGLEQRVYVTQDANYNTTALTDTSGAVQERYTYDPYGVTTIYDGSYTTRGSSSYAWVIGWQGMQFDGVSGLFKTDTRDISPTLGRATRVDPLGYVNGPNTYQWEKGGPSNRLDPSGLEVWMGLSDDGMPTGIWYQDTPIAGKPGWTRRYYYKKKTNWFWSSAEFARCETFKNGSLEETQSYLDTHVTGLVNSADQAEITAGNVVDFVNAYLTATSIVDGAVIASSLSKLGYRIITNAAGRKVLITAGKELTEEETALVVNNVAKSESKAAKSAKELQDTAVNACKNTCFLAGTDVLLGDGRTEEHIENIHVGQRVATDGGVANSDDGKTEAADPNATEVRRKKWRLVTIVAGDWEVRSLQPLNEIKADHERSGGSINLSEVVDLAEMGVPEGLVGTVRTIDPCPAVEDGLGRVVLMTVSHLNDFVYRLTLTDGQGDDDTIGVTGYHKIYTEDRGWTNTSDLTQGEVVRTATGDVKVSSCSPEPGTYTVYNMTVETDHVYYVGDLTTLVHNNACRQQGLQNLRDAGLKDVVLENSSYNSGRKQLEGAGFKIQEPTVGQSDGRTVFYNSETGATVIHDSGDALTHAQDPHWHIRDSSGNALDRGGRIADTSANAGHIPG